MIKIAVFSHDAGGAQFLSHWVKNNNCNEYRYSLKGPAIKIFKENIKQVELTETNIALEWADIIYCSSSYYSNFEKEIILQSKKLGKFCISFLEHWSYYYERYSFNNKINLPDEIWVGDKYANSLVKEFFPNIKVRLIQNYYFKYVSKKIRDFSKSSNSKKNILYVGSSWIEIDNRFDEENKRYFSPDDDSIIYLMKNINLLNTEIKHIYIRPHPSDPDKKYDEFANQFSLIKICDSRISLEQYIGEAEIIIGCDTMPMVFALLNNKRVICSLPPERKIRHHLPYKEIESLEYIIKNQNKK